MGQASWPVSGACTFSVRGVGRAILPRGPLPQQHPQALAVGRAKVLGRVQVVCEVELAGLRLVQVPEDISAQRVAHEGLHFAHAVAPVRTRHARVVHLAGANHERSAIQQKLVSAPGEGVRAVLRPRAAGQHGRRQHAREKLSSIARSHFLATAISTAPAAPHTLRAAGRATPAAPAGGAGSGWASAADRSPHRYRSTCRAGTA